MLISEVGLVILTLQQFKELQWVNENWTEEISSISYTHKQSSIEKTKLVVLRGGRHKAGSVFIVVLEQSSTVEGNYHSDWSHATYYDNLPEAATAFNTLYETARIEKAWYDTNK
ncbi:hypothetical protein [Klebsiella grimontii]|uniref:hypothetical protein n=1 Tax=Klebsiella grimontii TaxID=2058152 RepID=UPI0012B6CE44|nr:hypothetical protein [Klebsiella grimontii]